MCLIAMGTPAVADEKIQSLMQDNRLPQQVKTYLVQTLAIDCLSRAQNSFTEASLANDVNDLLTACGWFPAGNPAQVRAARLVAGDIKQF